MILVGNQRGGAKDLARHLMSPENDHVHVEELRGFVSDNLNGALNEAYAVSRGTRCKQYLFSLSLNPPLDADVSTADFIAAIDRVERDIGLEEQPRAIVFHEKEGPHGQRRHAHAVWSRIDPETMTARNLSWHKNRLQDVSRDLYREHGWRMPEGFADRSKSDPRNFSYEEWSQAKRAEKDSRDIKMAFEDAWAISDSRPSFEHALKERGYWLARGDGRGFVAVDHKGEIYSVPRQANVKTKAVRERLGREDDLPSLSQAKEAMAQEMGVMLSRLRDEQYDEVAALRARHAQAKQDLVDQQRRERAAMLEALRQRQKQEQATRQARFRSGLAGIWDRMRGEHKRVVERNCMEALSAQQRDQERRDALVFRQLQQRRILSSQSQERLERLREKTCELDRDKANIEQISNEHEPTKPQRRRRKQRVQTGEPPMSGTSAVFGDAAKGMQMHKPRRIRGNSADRKDGRDNGPSLDR